MEEEEARLRIWGKISFQVTSIKMHVNDANSHRDRRRAECLEAKSRHSVKETLNSITGVQHGKSRKGPCGLSSEKIVDELLLLQKHWE